MFNDLLVANMTYEDKALEILRVIAQDAADGKSLTIAQDWGFGSATVIDTDGSHTHIGCDSYKDDQIRLEAFVDGLHDLLVKGRGLSWAKPANEAVEKAPKISIPASCPSLLTASTLPH